MQVNFGSGQILGAESLSLGPAGLQPPGGHYSQPSRCPLLPDPLFLPVTSIGICTRQTDGGLRRGDEDNSGDRYPGGSRTSISQGELVQPDKQGLT